MKSLLRKTRRLAATRRGVLSIEYAAIGVVVVLAAALAFESIDWNGAINAFNTEMSP